MTITGIAQQYPINSQRLTGLSRVLKHTGSSAGVVDRSNQSSVVATSLFSFDGTVLVDFGMTEIGGVRRTRKFGHGGAKPSYGGGVWRSVGRSWMINQG